MSNKYKKRDLLPLVRTLIKELIVVYSICAFYANTMSQPKREAQYKKRLKDLKDIKNGLDE